MQRPDHEYARSIDHIFAETRNRTSLSMKKIFTIFIALFIATTGALFAEENTGTTLTTTKFGSINVHITGLKNLEGKFGVSLFNSKKGFPGKHQQACCSVLKIISSTSETVLFEHLPYGTYAVSIMHDENNNGKLDTNFIGIPKEGVGVSNNPKIGMGGPKFKDSVFTLDTKELEITVAMKYRIAS
jgi:uncharacterized protein (DUF2141 family)